MTSLVMMNFKKKISTKFFIIVSLLMHSAQLFVIFGLLAVVACVETYTTTYPTIGLETETVHVNPNGPPAHAFLPHKIDNAKGHRYYSENEKDQIYSATSPLSDAQLAALKIRAKELKQARAEHGIPMRPHPMEKKELTPEQEVFFSF